jgi:hypothetical protein
MQAEDSNSMEENFYDINYVVNVITKEVPKDERLVKQVLYTIFSAKSNEPINLAINAPTGQGKTYVVQKVADLFPKNDIVSLAGMSEKALFHRHGSLVIKNDDGKYISLEQKKEDIELQIQLYRNEVENTTGKDLKQNLKQARKYDIEDLEKQKKELYRNSKKLIELSGKTLIFLDSPPAYLLEALMPLLSHDRTEVEYEFVDTHNGIKTRGNILRGFPAVIFTAAKDYTNNQRYPEIQRRFLITNPDMSQEKYEKAIGCITAKYSLPDFAYQHEVVSDQEKERAKSIIINVQEKIVETCSSSPKRDHNQVYIPYYRALEACLPTSDASYMNAAKTLFIWISLLATIHQRPSIQAIYDMIDVQKIPLATFDDLKEAMSLIEHNNGVRPYVLQWYNEVFLPAYESKKEPDSKETKNGTSTENRIAVTTRYLVDKTAEIQKKRLSNKEILETFLNPLVNMNIISSEPSVLDGRANIYYPVKTNSKNRNLFDFASSNNISQYFQIKVENPAIYPDEIYTMNEIHRILKYSSDNRYNLVDHNGIERSIHEIVHIYYSNFGECFSADNYESTPNHNSTGYDFIITDHVSKEYLYNHQNNEELYVCRSAGPKNAITKHQQSIKLFDSSHSNNILYSYHNNLRPEIQVETATPKQTNTIESIEIPHVDSTDNSNANITANMIDSLFNYDPDVPYQSPAPHAVGESPFRSIIKQDSNQFHYCILHPNEKNINLESIEHHIIHCDPAVHRTEIKKRLGM